MTLSDVQVVVTVIKGEKVSSTSMLQKWRSDLEAHQIARLITDKLEREEF